MVGQDACTVLTIHTFSLLCHMWTLHWQDLHPPRVYFLYTYLFKRFSSCTLLLSSSNYMLMYFPLALHDLNHLSYWNLIHPTKCHHYCEFHVLSGTPIKKLMKEILRLNIGQAKGLHIFVFAFGSLSFSFQHCLLRPDKPNITSLELVRSMSRNANQFSKK